jgi:hypothetical protein
MPRSLAIPAADGTIDAQVFTPASASGPLPAVVMFTDIGGVRPSYYEKAQTVANAGYAVLLPNVYYRSVKGEAVPEGKSFRDPDVRAAATGYAKLLTPAALAGDFTALVGAIDEAPEFAAGGIAAIGYCMTGSFVIRMAAQHPDRVVVGGRGRPGQPGGGGRLDQGAGVFRSCRQGPAAAAGPDRTDGSCTGGRGGAFRDRVLQGRRARLHCQGRADLPPGSGRAALQAGVHAS